MATRSKWWKQFVVAALCSALASLMIVAVGPGFSKSDNASDKAADKSQAETASANASSNAGGGNASASKGVGGGSTSDNDGDHDSNENSALEDDHDSTDGGDNEHPSGKDRSVEHGKSANQGKAESNPDDSKGPERWEDKSRTPSRRGDDKPQGPGGTDRADQDGNNGCGNDDDFDDDNNGHCGKPASKGNDKPVCPVGTAKAGKPMPAGDVTKCDNGKPGERELCPSDSKMAGHRIPPPHDSSWCYKEHNNGGGPKGKVTICHRTGSATNPWVVITVSVNAWQAHQKHGDKLWSAGGCVAGSNTTKLCPEGTDYAGLPMPDGTKDSCDGDDETPKGRKCPKGTDLAGLPVPAGGIAACDTDVLGDIIGKGDDKGDDPDVAGASERKGGRALPFTGASIIAYVLLALMLIGAGALMARARRMNA